jgi:hypothetical protein
MMDKEGKGKMNGTSGMMGKSGSKGMKKRALTKSPTKTPSIAPTRNPNNTPTTVQTEAPTNTLTIAPTKTQSKAPNALPVMSSKRKVTRRIFHI